MSYSSLLAKVQAHRERMMTAIDLLNRIASGLDERLDCTRRPGGQSFIAINTVAYGDESTIILDYSLDLGMGPDNVGAMIYPTVVFKIDLLKQGEKHSINATFTSFDFSVEFWSHALRAVDGATQNVLHSMTLPNTAPIEPAPGLGRPYWTRLK